MDILSLVTISVALTGNVWVLILMGRVGTVWGTQDTSLVVIAIAAFIGLEFSSQRIPFLRDLPSLHRHMVICGLSGRVAPQMAQGIIDLCRGVPGLGLHTLQSMLIITLTFCGTAFLLHHTSSGMNKVIARANGYLHSITALSIGMLGLVLFA